MYLSERDINNINNLLNENISSEQRETLQYILESNKNLIWSTSYSRDYVAGIVTDDFEDIQYNEKRYNDIYNQIMSCDKFFESVKSELSDYDIVTSDIIYSVTYKVANKFFAYENNKLSILGE